MPALFPRTLRSLHQDGPLSTLAWVSVAAVLLAAWATWLTTGSVRVFERSERARVEVDGAPQAIQAPVAARVLTAHLALGRDVRAGEVLVELDARLERFALEEARRRREAAAAQIEFMRAELDANAAAGNQDRAAARATVAGARARAREAKARLHVAAEEAERLAALRQGGHVGEMELLRATTEARTRDASAEASSLDVSRLTWSLRTKASERLAVIARLRREIAALEGDDRTSASAIDRLAYEVERRMVRSPVAGRLGDVTVLREGSIVREGEALATVVPVAELRVVAEFTPATAVGRLQPGQAARVRLTGFNWAEYGELAAKVTRVATEPQAGLIRAELELAREAVSRIPVQHGLTGVVDVEVETATPATLVLRAAGRSAGGAPPPPRPSAHAGEPHVAERAP